MFQCWNPRGQVLALEDPRGQFWSPWSWPWPWGLILGLGRGLEACVLDSITGSSLLAENSRGVRSLNTSFGGWSVLEGCHTSFRGGWTPLPCGRV